MIVEVLDRRGHVLSRERVQLPVVVGRGYGCDVILDDAHADAAHARISDAGDGRFVVEDLGSVNGLRGAGGAERAPQLIIAPGGRFTIGETTLRLLTSEVPVPPALPLAGESVIGWRALVASPRAALLLSIVGTLVLSFGVWEAEVDGGKTGELAGAAVFILFMVMLWAAGWAAGARVARHRPRFLSHLAVAWIGVLVLMLPSRVLEHMAFALPDSLFIEIASWALSLAVMIWLLGAHLELASAFGRTRRMAVAIAITLSLTGLGLLLGSVDLEGEASIDAALAVEVVPLALIPSRTAEEFLADVVELQAKVDEEAAKLAARAAQSGR